MVELLTRNEVFEQLKQFLEGYGICERFEVVNNWESTFEVKIPIRTIYREVHKDQSQILEANND